MKILKFIIKASVTILILGIIVRTILREDFSEYEFNFNMWYLTPLIIITILNVIVLTYKWQKIIKFKNVEVPFFELLKLYFSGNFFSQFAPVIAGDGIRAYKLSKYTSESVHSVMSVLWVRVTGMVAIMLLAAAALPFVTSLGGTLIFITSIIIFFSLICFVMLIIFPHRISCCLDKISAKYGKKKIMRVLVSAVDNILEYSRNKSSVYLILGLSVIDHLTRITSFYILSLSLGYDVSFNYFLIFIPIACVVQMIPISLGGIGIREGIFIYLFTKVGLTSLEALTLSIVSHIFLAIFYLPGLYFFISDKNIKSVPINSGKNSIANVN